METISIIKEISGFIGSIFKGRNEIKKLKLEQKKALIQAETQRIIANTTADNDIDAMTVRDMKTTVKDDILIYLFLTPVFSVAIVPFIVAYKNNDWQNLNVHVLESFKTLDLLPDWYFYILVAIVIAVLGFRSFTRKLADKLVDKFINK